MSIFARIVTCSLIAVPAIQCRGEDPKSPPAAVFLAQDGRFDLEVSQHPESTETAETPSQRELVSILKRKLPQTNAAIELSDAPDWFQNLMQRIVRENVPAKYVQDKDWGKTDRRWDGLRIRREGLFQLTTKRRWKDVNHGTWKRYEITQVGPDENLTLQIENVHDAGNGKVGFDVGLAARLHVHGRTAKWAKGIQLYSVSADARARVAMKLACELGMKLDVLRFPPDVVLMPEVTEANLDVADFELQSVSKLDGPVVKQLSNSVHQVLLDKLQEKRDQLPQKINRQIAKNQDKMRLSLADFAADKWHVLMQADSAAERVSATPASSDEQGTLEAMTQQPVIPTPEDRFSTETDAGSIGESTAFSKEPDSGSREADSIGPVLVGPGN